MEGLPATVRSRRPIYLVFDHDLAGLVGTILKNDFELKNDVLAIDGITLHDFDFIDLGKALGAIGYGSRHNQVFGVPVVMATQDLPRLK